MIVNELVSRFSFLGSLAPQEKFNLNLASSIKLIGGVAAGLAGATAGFWKMQDMTLRALNPLVDLSKEIGVGVEAIQELGYAAQLTGSSAQQMQEGLAGLSRQIGATAMGMGRFAKRAFDRLGISVRDAAGQVKSADVVLEEMRQRFADLNVGLEEQLSITQALGLSPHLIQMLRLTDTEMAGLRNEARRLGIVTESGARGIASYNDAMDRMKFALQGLQNRIAIHFAPVLEKMANGLTEFFLKHGAKFATIVEALGEGLIRLTKALKPMAPLLLAVGAAFALAFSPLTTTIAVGLAVLDDLLVAMRGGRSVIAGFFQEFFGIDIVPVLRDLRGRFGTFVDSLKTTFEPLLGTLKNIFEAAIAFFKGDTETAVTKLQDALVGVFETIGRLGASVKAALAVVLGDELTNDIYAAFERIGKAVVKLFAGDFEGAYAEIKPILDRIGEYFKTVFRTAAAFVQRELGQMLTLKNIAPELWEILDFVGYKGRQTGKAIQDNFTGKIARNLGAVADIPDERRRLGLLPLAAPTSGGNTTTVTLSPTVQINGVQDPLAVGAAVRRELDYWADRGVFAYAGGGQ